MSNLHYSNSMEIPHKLPPQAPLPPPSQVSLFPQSIFIVHESSEVVTLVVHSPLSQVRVTSGPESAVCAERTPPRRKNMLAQAKLKSFFIVKMRLVIVERTAV